ncbi:MAG: ATP-binding protein [Trueperaceae bacterium]|nr:ATP-binding protein [Trueperaceae bacterium]
MSASLALLGPDVPGADALARLADGPVDAADAARAELLAALLRQGAADPWLGVADALVHGASDAWARADAAPGLAAWLVRDVATLAGWLHAAAPAFAPPDGPPLADLAPAPAPGPVADVAAALRRAPPAAVTAQVRTWRRTHGGGPLARFRALRWDGATLHGVPHPSTPDLAALVALERPIDAFVRNVEAFVDGRPAMDALLYGPRGSGKSTVVRGVLPRFAERGLRLVEVHGEAVAHLGALADRLRGRPERFLVFVDDLAFEAGDGGYRPLKSVLEGGLAARPANVRLVVTSNRRHLLQERLRDRPDPLDDDVHAWDTQQERLALADRFGLVVTFPSADRRRYLEVVRGLVAQEGGRGALERAAGGLDEAGGDPGTDPDGADLEGRADRFAREGNGYSGRTARQFVDAWRAGLA